MSPRSNKAHSEAHDKIKPQNKTKSQKTQNHAFLMRSGNIVRTKTSVSTVVTLVIQAVTAPTHSTQTKYPLKMTKPNPNRPKHTPRNM